MRRTYVCQWFLQYTLVVVSPRPFKTNCVQLKDYVISQNKLRCGYFLVKFLFIYLLFKIYKVRIGSFMCMLSELVYAILAMRVYVQGGRGIVTLE